MSAVVLACKRDGGLCEARHGEPGEAFVDDGSRRSGDGSRSVRIDGGLNENIRERKDHPLETGGYADLQRLSEHAAFYAELPECPSDRFVFGG